MRRKKSFKSKIKKNRYNLLLILLGLILLVFSLNFIGKKLSDLSFSEYDNEILVIKDSTNKQDSFSIKELRKRGTTTSKVTLNQGLENLELTGVPLEKLLSDLGYELNNSPSLSIEDSRGNTKSYPMSIALEVDRVLLTYKINGKVNDEYDPSLGTITLIDTQSDSKSSWIKDVKIISID
ncbi:MAG: hypothetical protein Q4E50_00905 [Tissierellia bacterium]|nr:hypothetical protein [Tissierellia bacterium]